MAERAQNYSMEDREAAVAAYVVGGTYSRAETICGIHQTTIRKWHDRDPSWWEGVERTIRIQHEQEHRAKIREIVVDGLAELHDRIRNGDVIVDKEGNEVRRKMSGKDLNIATGTMIDKLRVSLGQATSIAGKSADSATDKLDALRKAATTAAKEQAKEDGTLVELNAEGRAESCAAPTKTPVAA
jgi:hypothetical protein